MKYYFSFFFCLIIAHALISQEDGRLYPFNIISDVEYSNGLNYRKGLIDKDGKIIIPPSYWTVRDIQDEYIKVGAVTSGIINDNGEIILDNYQFSMIKIIGNNLAIAVDIKNVTYNLINFKGEIIRKFPLGYRLLRRVGSYIEFKTIVEENDEKYIHGLLDLKGNELVRGDFRDIEEHRNRIFLRNGKDYGYFDEDLNFIVFNLKNLDSFGVSYWHDGVAMIRSNNKFGYVNMDGELIIPCEYGWGQIFSDGKVLVQKDEKWIYLDDTGEILFGKEFDFGTPFYNGVAVVSMDQQKYFMDSNGSLTAIKENGFTTYNDNYDLYNQIDEGIVRIRKDNQYGFINLITKNVVLP